MNLLKGICTFALLSFLIACGGGSSTRTPVPTPTATPTPTPVAAGFAVTPSSATVALGAHQAFSASSNGTSVAVNWSVNGIAGGNATVGTIDVNGNFIGPAAFPSPNMETITATLQSDNTKMATASATIVFPNNNTSAQSGMIKLGTSGGNANDFSAKFCCSGTLGSLISRGGSFFILSNNHVLDKSGQGAVNDPITQPGLVDNHCTAAAVVAHMSEAAALMPTNTPSDPACMGQPTPCGPAPKNVDAAIAQIASGQVDTSGSILDLGAAGPSSIAAAPPSATVAVPAAVLSSNEGVAKSGRTSGLTCSNLQSISTEVSVQYDSSCGGATSFTATFKNQLIINGGNFSAGGDSGSLIVTSDTARPLGLLYGGDSNSTSAHPIQDVLNAFQSGANNATMVGGADHAVSCEPTATIPAAGQGGGANAASLPVAERQRVAAVRDKQSAVLLQDPAVTSTEVGASDDSPGEGALVVHVTGATRAPIPPVIDGVRTKVMFNAQGGRAPMPVLDLGVIEQSTAVKEKHQAEWMSQPGIQGIGVGRSSDNPGETAIVIYVISGQTHPAIPQLIDGVRTKIVEGDRFRSSGWGKETKPAPKCRKK